MTDDVAEKRLYSEIIDPLDTCTKCFMYASNLELANYTPDSKVSKYSTSLLQPSPHLKLSQTRLLPSPALTCFDRANALWTPVAGYGRTILL